MPCVNDQITDGMTQSNLAVLGSGPAIAIAQSELSLAQAQGVLFANMLANQHQVALSSNAAMTEGIMTLLSSAQQPKSGDSQLAAVLSKMTDVLEKQLSNLDSTLATS